MEQAGNGERQTFPIRAVLTVILYGTYFGATVSEIEAVLSHALGRRVHITEWRDLWMWAQAADRIRPQVPDLSTWLDKRIRPRPGISLGRPVFEWYALDRGEAMSLLDGVISGWGLDVELAGSPPVVSSEPLPGRPR